MENKNPENRFFHANDETADSQKAGRILYIVIISILCLSAILVGVIAALNQSNDPVTPPADDGSSTDAPTPENPDKPDDGETDVTPDVDVDKIPVFVAPVHGSVSENHSPDMPVFNLTMDDYRTHDGIDITASSGAAVYSVADGTVTKVYEDPLMGVSVEVSMNGKAVAVYQNLGEVAEGIKEGAAVKSGDVIASVGESALIECGEEPHLHFSLAVDGKSVDPLAYFSDEVVETYLSGDTSYEDEE